MKEYGSFVCYRFEINNNISMRYKITKLIKHSNRNTLLIIVIEKKNTPQSVINEGQWK